MNLRKSLSARSIEVDIEDPKRAETLLAGENRLLEMIAKGAPVGETLDAICRLVEQVAPEWLASILLLDRSAATVWHGAAPMLPKGYVAALEGKPVSPTYAPWGLAAQGQQVVAADIAADTRWSSEYRELAVQHGLRASLSTPIESSKGAVLGILEVYFRRPTTLVQQHHMFDAAVYLASIAIERAQSTPVEAIDEMLSALRHSEDRYARAMEAANEGHWEWNIAGDEMFVSVHMKEMLGFAPDTQFTSGADFFARRPIHPDDRSFVNDVWQDALSGATPRYEIEYRVLPRPGQIRWVRSRGKVFCDQEGHPVRITGSFTDVTDRKLADEALRSSEERYALAMEASGEGFWDWNIVTDEYYLSPRMIELLRLPSDITFKSRSDFLDRIDFHPEDRPRWQEAIDAHFAGKTARFDVQIRIVPHGETRWIHLMGLLSRDPSGKPVRWTGSCADVTERKRAVDGLQASEQRFRQLFENSADILLIHDEQGRYVDCNAAACKALGYSREELLNMSVADIVLRQVSEDERRVIWEHAREREPGAMIGTQEREVRRKDGTIFPVEASLGAIGYEGRHLVYASLRDITDRKSALAALHHGEARFRSLTELSTDWFWEQDENLRFSYLSNQADNLTGYTGASSLGKKRWELENMTPLVGTWPEHEAVLNARLPFRDLEVRRVAPDGQVWYLSISGAPIFDEQGRFNGYQGTGRNITERKRIEEELRSRQDMLDLAQRSAGAVAWQGDYSKNPERNRWSSDLEAMFGIPAGSFDGTTASWRKLIHPDDWPSVRAAMKRSFETGEIDVEYRVPQADGAVRWLHQKGRTFLGEDGKPTSSTGFMFDVTERHKSEEDLARLEKQLRLAQRLESMGTLAGGIAHDFNNILGAILGYSEMALRDVRKGSRLQRDLVSIVTAGERGRALIDRILAFSRSGLGEHVAVHVEKVAREAIDLLAAKMPPKGIRVQTKLRAGRAAILGDATQVHQVVMNLATNAVQAMPSGGTLRVSLEAVRLEAQAATIGNVAGGDYVVLKVADSGTGIPREIIDRIFDPFFTTKEVGTGTGLGLSLVHGIVAELGGAIDVASTPGQGSEFTVYLPRWGDASPSPQSSETEDVQMPRGAGQRVLIVDDEEPLANIVARTLEDLGYIPTTYTSSVAALAAFKGDPERYAALITDERMPGLSGTVLIQEVRSLRPTIPILLVTGHMGAVVVQRAKEAGADEVLKKPLAARDLATTLARVLPR